MVNDVKTLYFEGAGWEDAESSKATIGNCRIRTAFHRADGQPIYLELSCSSVGKTNPVYVGHANHCFCITNDVPNDDENQHSLIKQFLHIDSVAVRGSHRPRSEISSVNFPYTKEGVLKVVTGLGGDFDNIEVVNLLGGYCVFKNSGSGVDRYNYGDEFVLDKEILQRREAVRKVVYDMELRELKEDRANRTHNFVHSPTGDYPNFSLWPEDGTGAVLHLLRHFNGYNKHYIINVESGESIEDWVASMTEVPLGRYGC